MKPGYCEACGLSGYLEDDGTCPDCGSGVHTEIYGDDEDDTYGGYCEACELSVILDTDGTCPECGSGVHTYFYNEPD